MSHLNDEFDNWADRGMARLSSMFHHPSATVSTQGDAMKSDGRCRSCGAPIRWAINDHTGSRMPLDAEANPAGNISVVEWGAKQPSGLSLPIVGVNIDPSKAMTPMRYTSHFATCPDADDWRKRK